MASALDSEIEQLRERAAVLRKQVQVQTSTLLLAESTRELARQAGGTTTKDLLEVCDVHTAHQQQSLYRAGASITAFRVRDPDPNAVDGGRVLGLRLDTMMGAQFLRPYYVFLVRDPVPAQRRPAEKHKTTAGDDSGGGGGGDGGPLRVHRHTVPASIPLAALATRYLHVAPDATGSSDLYGFARALRRALVRYHNRLAVIGDLRRAVQRRQKPASDASDANESSQQLADVSGADAEAKQIRLDWADGRTGRLLVDDDGDIQQLVVIGATGARDLAAARALLGGETTATGLARRLAGA